MLWETARRIHPAHRKLLAAVVVCQPAQSIASLYLPTLNADIVDESEAKGNIGYRATLAQRALGTSLICGAAALDATMARMLDSAIEER